MLFLGWLCNIVGLLLHVLIPLEFLDLGEVRILSLPPSLFWHFGATVLIAAGTVMVYLAWYKPLACALDKKAKTS